MPNDVRGAPGKNAALALRIEEIRGQYLESRRHVAVTQLNSGEHGLFAARLLFMEPIYEPVLRHRMELVNTVHRVPWNLDAGWTSSAGRERSDTDESPFHRQSSTRWTP
jgi:hypothetical protein